MGAALDVARSDCQMVAGTVAARGFAIAAGTPVGDASEIGRPGSGEGPGDPPSSGQTSNLGFLVGANSGESMVHIVPRVFLGLPPCVCTKGTSSRGEAVS